ncbi:hypothetical protein BD626DRAFT_149840 [Schizophyllum amplum]|uniref:Uncharacterized protein n=1 Tax=Schizophyllum amplum TaxID=97359 RepID=A0A550C3Z4_9AGAR|nr:hypothetical protein BD626DRAFT_149840 [Auriculariopsis ampla]
MKDERAIQGRHMNGKRDDSIAPGPPSYVGRRIPSYTQDDRLRRTPGRWGVTHTGATPERVSRTRTPLAPCSRSRRAGEHPAIDRSGIARYGLAALARSQR